MPIPIKRAYEKPTPNDGYRVLIDGLWPRGIRKEEAGIDLWLKEVAPSGELRKWFAHDPEKWDEFRRCYFLELDKNPDVVKRLADMARRGKLTLVYGAKEERFNNAVALKEYLEKKVKHIHMAGR
jgi:uncharacterized protein YeaO (DUF488 family)